MERQTNEFSRVMKEQGRLYDEMVRSVWGDRMAMAMTASALAGMGMGLLFGKSWKSRAAGAVCYAGAVGMQFYSIMSPERRSGRTHGRTHGGETTAAEATARGSRANTGAETRAA